MYNMSVLSSGKHQSRWRYILAFVRGCRFFLICLPDRGEVSFMYVTWELLFLFGGFILALLTYIDLHNKKK